MNLPFVLLGALWPSTWHQFSDYRETDVKSHYELLEIQTDASERDIRHAWAKLVRRFPPDQHPDANRLLNEAKTCLLDSSARAAYDERLLHGDELDRLLKDATKCMDESDFDGATEILAELVALGPTRADARWMLAQCYEYKSDFKNAERQYIRLNEVEPSSGIIAYGLANVYHAWGAVRANKFDIADKWYQAAIALEPYNSQYYQGRAENFAVQKKYDKAEACLIEAISADGRKDIDDLDTILRLLGLFVETGQVSRLVEVSTIVKECVDGDKDAATLAANKILDFVDSFVEATKDWETSGKFVSSMRAFCAHFGDRETFASAIELRCEAAKQLKSLTDSNIQPVIVIYIIKLYALPELDGSVVNATTVSNLRKEIGNWSYSEVQQGWNTAKIAYPQLCNLVQAKVLPILDYAPKELVTNGNDEASNGQDGGQMQSSIESNAWLMLLKIVATLILLFAVIRNFACN
jgi:tetratricopeptide (TPR) repeat protein